jgi:hypothetical protein
MKILQPIAQQEMEQVPVLLPETFIPLQWQTVVFQCKKKDCCRKYKKPGKKRCKKCPAVN